MVEPEPGPRRGGSDWPFAVMVMFIFLLGAVCFLGKIAALPWQ